MFDRRHLLKAGILAGASLSLPLEWAPKAFANNNLPEMPSVGDLSPTLAKFVDPLPRPGILRPTGKKRGALYYEVPMTQFVQKLHRDLPPTKVWGYHGTYPGPTIEACVDDPIYVKWINSLPHKHLLPIDHTLHGAEPPTPDVRAVVHLHGGNVPPQSDGFPEAWFTPGHSATYFYPNAQQATTLWYHDHALGITRLNVYAGLAAFYLLRDKAEAKLNLPRDPYELPIVIQDRTFQKNGQLFYPNQGVTHPVWVPEFFGDTAVVNGKVWPYLEVEPRKYRFRLLNGSNARFYRLKLSSGQPFVQIGGDQGFLPHPVLVDELILAPAERADVILDFSHHKGAHITMTNDAPAPFPGGGGGALPEIMQFRVKKTCSGHDTSSIPGTLPAIYRPGTAHVAKVRPLTLNEYLDAQGNSIMLLLDAKHWDDPITEKPKRGTTEIWELVNLTGDTHPIHLHLVHFFILDRIPFNQQAYEKSGKIVYTGTPIPPDPNERGPKDTVRANPGQVTRILVPFDSRFTGEYVWHCHILEHEDNEMMRPYKVIP